MIVKNTFILLVILLLGSCKTTSDVGQQDHSQTQTTPIVLLLDENLSPADLTVVKEYQIENMKRTSRSQNQWMIHVAGGEKVALELLEKLKKTNGVQKCSLQNNDQQSKEIETSKSGKSGTIKNK